MNQIKICPTCGGAGKIPCNCLRLEELKKISSFESPNRRERLGIYRCQDCGQLWKIRWKWDDETGADDIWLKPGEKERGYEFTLEEAEEFKRKGE